MGEGGTILRTVWGWSRSAEGQGAPMMVGLAALALAVIVMGRSVARRRKLRRIARRVTARHARLLLVKRHQLVAHDGYGNQRLRPWIDHVDYFIGHVILREARARGLTSEVVKGSRLWSELTRILLATLRAHDGEAASPAQGQALSGQHYETLCRSLLEADGWRVASTPVTGDQGADLIAEAQRLRVIIQCKFHARPVGNKAVQEAHAALGFHGGDLAAVVSNASFTRSAQALARTTGVMLLHHGQLRGLYDDIRRLRPT